MSAPSFDRVMEALDHKGCLPPHVDGRNNGRLSMMVRCPAHEDSDSSLSITHAGDRTLLHCFAGCDTERVVEMLELAFADLFDERRNTTTRRPKVETDERYAGRLLNVGELLAQPDEPIPWRCESFAADGYLTVLAGRGKEGKSWFTLALSCAVAREALPPPASAVRGAGH
jgi:hypothetical protein